MEQGNSSKIAKGGFSSGCILQMLREQSSDVGQGKGKRECLENVKKHIPALITATLNIQQGSPECAKNSKQGSIIGDGFKFQFQVQNELHTTKVT